MGSLPILIIILLLNKSILTNNFNYLITIKILFLNNFYLIMFFISFLVKFPVFFFPSMIAESSCRGTCKRINDLGRNFTKIRWLWNYSRVIFFEKIFFLKFVMIFSLFGGSILSIICLINRDIKVIIAYSSVVHSIDCN